jgi:hypothetical protein
MKSNEISHSFIIHGQCKYFHMIFGTYNMALSCHFQRKYCINLSYPFILEGNMKEKGSKFIVKRSDLNLYTFYEITDLIITDYYTLFKFHIYKTIPETFDYDYILEIRYIDENQCEFFVSFVFEGKYFLSEEELQEEFKFRKVLYKNIESSLRKFEIFKIVTINTTIKCNIELIFDILKNMKVIHKYVHLLGDNINYDGKILKKNSIIHLTDFIGELPIESTAQVHNIIISKSEISKEYIIEFLFQNNKNSISENSKSKILIIIYEYNGFCTMHLFYFFHHIQNKENFFRFRKAKNMQLIKFKKIVENFARSKKAKLYEI